LVVVVVGWLVGGGVGGVGGGWHCWWVVSVVSVVVGGGGCMPVTPPHRSSASHYRALFPLRSLHRRGRELLLRKIRTTMPPPPPPNLPLPRSSFLLMLSIACAVACAVYPSPLWSARTRRPNAIETNLQPLQLHDDRHLTAEGSVLSDLTRDAFFECVVVFPRQTSDRLRGPGEREEGGGGGGRRRRGGGGSNQRTRSRYPSCRHTAR